MASSGEIEKLERRWAENQLGLTFAPLAEAYRKAGDPERALLLLETGLAQHPNYIPAHIVRGRCHLDTQADGAAELSFLRVTELDPENVIALKSLAEISERAGRLPEAMRRLELLLDVDRNNEEARGQLDRVREVYAASHAAPPPPSVVEAPLPVMEEVEMAAEAVPEAPAPVRDETPLEPVSPADDEMAPVIQDEEVVPAAAASQPVNEYMLPNDSETLLPSDEGIEDIILAEETELEVREPVEAPVEEPVAAGESDWLEASALVLDTPVPIVDVQPPPPPDDSYESFLPPPPEPPPAAEVPGFEPEPAPAWEEPAEVAVESIAAPPEALFQPVGAHVEEPASAPESGPEPESELEPESEPADLPAREPELVVTETMAEIFLRQGHRELALAVYTQLSLRDPDNRRLAELAAALSEELAPPAPPPPPQEPAPRYAAAETGGRSVQSLLGALLSASRPAVATAIHPPAFEAPRRPAGEPTRPAQEPLSLGAVFGDEAAPAGPASPPVAPGAEPSFEEFFAPGSSADAELPRPPAHDTAAAASQVPEDLEQFNAWLRGLKR
jgi:thioredoxin-like negative regulator of GroEL